MRYVFKILHSFVCSAKRSRQKSVMYFVVIHRCREVEVCCREDILDVYLILAWFVLGCIRVPEAISLTHKLLSSAIKHVLPY